MKSIIISVIIMLVIWALMPIFAIAGAENAFKIDQTKQYVAVFPSVWAGMKMMSPLWWIAAILISIMGGFFAGVKVDDAEAGQKIVPTVGIGLLTAVVCWFVMHSPATFQQDFTHKTIPASEFDAKVAAKGGYDFYFKKFNQADELYNGPAVFANPQ